MAEIRPYLQRMSDSFADPAVQAALKGFTRTIQFEFSDTHESWLLRAIDGKQASLVAGAVEKPDILVTMATETLIGLMDGSISGFTALLQRKLQIHGPVADLLKLQKLMK